MNIKQKVQDAVLDMMKKVKMDEVKHVYTRVDNGEWLQGVSTVSSIIPKEWLAPWGAKECAKALGYSDYEGDTESAAEILKKIKALKPIKEGEKIVKSVEQQWIEMLKEAKGASGRKSKTALVDGKKGHEWLELYVKAQIRGTEIPNMPEGNLVRPLTQFVEWAEKAVAYWIVSEARVAYPDRGYAGTMDAAAMMKTGNLAVVDYKFASHISEDYFLQTAGYQATFEPYGIPFDERVIVRLPKTLEREEYDKATFKYFMVPNDLEVLTVPTSYEDDRDTFYAALPVKRWINKVEGVLEKNKTKK